VRPHDYANKDTCQKLRRRWGKGFSSLGDNVRRITSPDLLTPTFPCSFRTSGAISAVYGKRSVLIQEIASNPDLLHELNYGACLQVWARLAELLKSNEPRVRVTQDPMTISNYRQVRLCPSDWSHKGRTQERLDHSSMSSRGTL
jgi:hypothetical protein